VPPAVAEVSGTEPEQELAALKSQTESLQTTLSQVRKRIEELEAKPRRE
jgi:prefoldin subunit 5